MEISTVRNTPLSPLQSIKSKQNLALFGATAYSAGIFCMALVYAIGKHLTQGYPVMEIIFFRSLLAVLPLGIMATRTGWHTMHTRRPVLHVIRGVTILCTLAFFFWSLRYLPLADATALNLTS